MEYKIAIVEDNIESLNLLKSYIEKYANDFKIEAKIDAFYDGLDIVTNYKGNYDIIFLDIEMKKMDGMNAASKIRKLDEEVIIIFITNMHNYAIKGYLVNALSFLLKPLSYFSFKEEFKKALKKIDRRQNYIFINEKGLIRKINLKEIIYIESLNHDLIINCKKDQYFIRETMKKMEERLKDEYFFRINNRFLINFEHIDFVENNDITIGSEHFSISRRRKKDFYLQMANYMGNKS